MTSPAPPSSPLETAKRTSERAIAHPLPPRLMLLGMVLLVLGVPITDLWRFLLLLATVIAVCFWNVSYSSRHWLFALLIAVGGAASAWLIPGPQIEVGENVYIPLGQSFKAFEQGLPPEANAVMQSTFDRTYLANGESLGSVVGELFQKSEHAGQAFSPSADALWQQPKYSRVVDGLSFKTQDQARIGAINRLQYNFYRVPDIDRTSMPFFVMAELNRALVGGNVCWRGDVLWEQDKGAFPLLRKVSWGCQEVGEGDAGRRVLALSIGTPVEFAVYPPWPLGLAVWLRNGLRAAAVMGIFGLLVSVDSVRTLLLPIGSAVSTLVTTTILWPQYFLGFRTLAGGSDGLTHESRGFDIAQAVHDGRWADALRGGESIFYFMPGLRYFRALELFLFGETNFGIVLCTMFFPIFLFYGLRRLLPLRWAVALISLFLFTPIFMRFGFAHFLFLREMIKGVPEPVGYTAFMGGLALLAQYIPTPMSQKLAEPMPGGWIGFALAVSVAMRPNLVLPSLLLLSMTAAWLASKRRWGEILWLGVGFAPVLLIPLHNWYFGHQLVPLTSGAFTPDNLTAPPSVYWAAAKEIAHRDFSGEALPRVLRQLRKWNQPIEFYRVVALLIVIWVAIRRESALTAMQALAVVALVMQAMLLFYLPSGRYSLLAWLLVFTIVVVEAKEAFLPWARETWRRSALRLNLADRGENDSNAERGNRARATTRSRRHFLAAYNFVKRLKTPRGFTPHKHRQSCQPIL